MKCKSFFLKCCCCLSFEWYWEKSELILSVTHHGGWISIIIIILITITKFICFVLVFFQTNVQISQEPQSLVCLHNSKSQLIAFLFCFVSKCPTLLVENSQCQALGQHWFEFSTTAMSTCDLCKYTIWICLSDGETFRCHLAHFIRKQTV